MDCKIQAESFHAGHFMTAWHVWETLRSSILIDTLRMMPVFGREQVVAAYTDQIRALADRNSRPFRFWSSDPPPRSRRWCIVPKW